MARKLTINGTSLKAERKKAGLNQTDFWGKYAVTQSGGCRYEAGRPVPQHLAILMYLEKSGRVNADDIAEAVKNTRIEGTE